MGMGTRGIGTGLHKLWVGQWLVVLARLRHARSLDVVRLSIVWHLQVLQAYGESVEIFLSYPEMADDKDNEITCYILQLLSSTNYSGVQASMVPIDWT